MGESRFLGDKNKEDCLKEGALGASKHQRCIILSVQIVSCEISTRFEGLLSKLTEEWACKGPLSMLVNSNLKLD